MFPFFKKYDPTWWEYNRRHDQLTLQVKKLTPNPIWIPVVLLGIWITLGLTIQSLLPLWIILGTVNAGVIFLEAIIIFMSFDDGHFSLRHLYPLLRKEVTINHDLKYVPKEFISDKIANKNAIYSDQLHKYLDALRNLEMPPSQNIEKQLYDWVMLERKQLKANKVSELDRSAALESYKELINGK